MRAVLVVSAFLLALACPEVTSADAPDAGRVVVLSDPRGLEVFVDGRSSGRTPLELGIPAPGRHTIRVRHPLERNWPARDMKFEVDVEAGACDTVFAKFGGILFVDSGPSPVEVYLDGRRAGETPILLRGLSPGPHTLRSSVPGYSTWKDSLSLTISPGEFRRISLPHVAPARQDLGGQGRGGWLGRSRTLTISSAVIAISSGVGAYLAKKAADRAYESYLRSGNPEKMDLYFRRAERYDRIASGMWMLSEIGFVATFYFAIF